MSKLVALLRQNVFLAKIINFLSKVNKLLIIKRLKKLQLSLTASIRQNKYTIILVSASVFLKFLFLCLQLSLLMLLTMKFEVIIRESLFIMRSGYLMPERLPTEVRIIHMSNKYIFEQTMLCFYYVLNWFFHTNILNTNIFVILMNICLFLINFIYAYVNYFESIILDFLIAVNNPDEVDNLRLNSTKKAIFQLIVKDKALGEYLLFNSFEKYTTRTTFTHFPYCGNKPVALLSIWQYWWWFFFISVIIFLNTLVFKIFIEDHITINLKSYSSLKSNGRWGDAVAVIFPIFWCFNILVNSNYILRSTEHFLDSNWLTVRIRGKQWYWVYKITINEKLLYNNNSFLIGNNKPVKVDVFYYKNSTNSTNLKYKNLFHKKLKNLSCDNNKLSNVNRFVAFKSYLEIQKNTSTSQSKINFLYKKLNFDLNNKILLLKKNKEYSKYEYKDLSQFRIFLTKNPLYVKHYGTVLTLKTPFKYKYRAYTRTFIDQIQQRKLKWLLYNTKKFNVVTRYGFSKIMFTKSYLRKKWYSGLVFYGPRYHSKVETRQLHLKLNLYNTSSGKSEIKNHINFVKLKRLELRNKKLLTSFSEYKCFDYKNYKFFKKATKTPNLVTVKKTNRINTLNRLRMLSTNNTLVVPTNVNITIITNSFDVVHSWFVPGLGIKFDAVPGRSTHYSLKIQKPGIYIGHCAEICGRYHHNMPIRIIAVPLNHYFFIINSNYVF